MKKIVLYITIMVCFGYSVFAQSKDLKGSQLAIRNSIQSYLKSEGFQPEIDDDGDIKFKRQGGTYFVSVSATDENPVFVQLNKYFKYGDELTQTKLVLFSMDNNYKACKIRPLKEMYIISGEFFIHNASAFTSVFYRILNVMDTIETSINEI